MRIRFPIPSMLVLALAGCATPRYETVTLRQPPTDSAAPACLAACERNLEVCKHSCAEKFQACLNAVEPEAEAHYRQTLERYAEGLERNRRDLASYEFQLWSSFHWGRGAYWYDPFPFHHPPPPLLPRVPSREEDLKRFRESRCGADCGCQSPYDACFVACGGRISGERRCVENCPDGP